MIDYRSIGQKVKEIHLSEGIMQEQLPEAVDVGVTHISHLETGLGSVSLKVFIGIINYLKCSADEILCKEIAVAKPLVDNWLAELVADCMLSKVKIIADTVTVLKQTLKKKRAIE